jgi:energy-coupling factor transporter ATP-binding protein EcfA2
MSSPPPSPPFLNRFWPGLLPVLAILGFPATALAFFLTKHPLLALGIGLLYEVVVLLCSFLMRVWQKWEEPRIEEIATRISWITSRTRKKYCEYLLNRHQYLDVKGLSTQGPSALALEQVFVDLSIVPTPAHEASADPLQVPSTLIPSTLSEGKHSIWDYLSNQSLKKQHLVIIGPPGSGKTTLLKQLVLALLHRKKQSQASRIPNKLPILLFLRDYVSDIKETSDFSLENAVFDQCKLLPLGWIQRQLLKGECLVCLDGLDEVVDEQSRQLIVDWIQQQMSIYNKNRFLITSRPFGYKSNRPVGSFLTIGYNRLFSHGLQSGMRTNSMERENAFSSPCSHGL